MQVSRTVLRGRRKLFGIPTPLARWGRLLSASPLVFIAILYLFAVGVCVLFADKISPQDPTVQNLQNRLVPPQWDGGSSEHLFGTDALGRDVLARLLYGARLAILIPLVGTVLSGTLGVLLGLIAGYYSGTADAIIMRLVDAQMAVSSKLLILVVVALVGPGVLTLMLIFGIAHWVLYTRILRGAVLSLREAPFVQAAIVIGCSKPRVIFAHVLPNLFGVLISVAAMEMAGLMVTEAGLSFLGFGVQPPTVTWGILIAEGRNYMNSAGWLIAFPGLAVTITMLALTFVGAWLRQITSPFRASFEKSR